MMRQRAGFGIDSDAEQFDLEYFDEIITSIEEYVINRIKGINARAEGQPKDDIDEIREEIRAFFKEWQEYVDRSISEGNKLYFGRRFMMHPPANGERRLLRQYNSTGKDIAIDTLTSMRNVDTPVTGNVIIWGEDNG